MDGQPGFLQKLPPQSIELEQGVLGAILLQNEALMRVLDVLHERDFYQEGHRWIFQTMLELFEENIPIDLLTVTERLRKNERLERAGGVAYLTELVELIPTGSYGAR
jgi:replicative DNA helicase